VPHALKETANNPRSVVILDDERSYVDSMAKLVSDNLNCTVHAFARAEAALAELPGISAAVIVTDYFMPQMDGVEFILEASKIVPDAVFIMISGHDLNPIEENITLLKNLRACLQKPVASQPLVEAILKAWPGDDRPAVRS
jgi:FixJ family two-component response regulator